MSREVALAMVTLSEPVLPNAEVLAGMHERLWPGSERLVFDSAGAHDEAPGFDEPTSVIFQWDDATAAFSLMPAPIPSEDIGGAAELARWYWPEAPETLAQHRAHWVVILLGGPTDPIERAMKLTELTATAAASLDEATGIYWGASNLLHPRDQFVARAREMDRESPPIELWVNFRLSGDDNDTVSLLTLGMDQFGHKEIEVHQSRRDPQFILDRVYNIAAYLLENGPVIEDGHTVGQSADEKFTVHIGPSKFDESMTVLRIDM
ncbi:hypothetical protein JCM19992_32480 [Thermostilla marina]